MNDTVVLKFGGAALLETKHFENIANIIAHKKKQYSQVVVVVSAMGKTTDHLLSQAKELNDTPPKRELDMLISVGERISMSLLAITLDQKGIEAVSLTGSQSGIITCGNHADAKIVDVKPKRILSNLSLGKVVIVAGFQGVSSIGEITTLGRNGSDVTAVALGVALNAIKVELYKDVDGVYDVDPKLHKKAILYRELAFEDAIILTEQKTSVIPKRALLLALKNQLPLRVCPFDSQKWQQVGGTQIGTIEKRSKHALYEDSRTT